MDVHKELKSIVNADFTETVNLLAHSLRSVVDRDNLYHKIIMKVTNRIMKWTYKKYAPRVPQRDYGLIQVRRLLAGTVADHY